MRWLWLLASIVSALATVFLIKVLVYYFLYNDAALTWRVIALLRIPGHPDQCSVLKPITIPG
jgi:hypothetical protein